MCGSPAALVATPAIAGCVVDLSADHILPWSSERSASRGCQEYVRIAFRDERASFFFKRNASGSTLLAPVHRDVRCRWGRAASSSSAADDLTADDGHGTRGTRRSQSSIARSKLFLGFRHLRRNIGCP